MTRLGVYFAVFLAVVVASTASAGVEYDAARRTLWITDYPRDYPCSPETLFQVDSARGWGVVKHDPTADTYAIDANLCVGDENPADAFFLVGDKNHTKQTVIIKGDLWVCPAPYYDESKPEDKLKNRRFARETGRGLFLGISGVADVQPKLLFAAEKEKNRSLRVGFFPDGRDFRPMDWHGERGVEFLCYNARIASLGAAPKREIENILLRCRKIRLVNCVISGVSGGLVGLYGSLWDHVAENVTFENMGVGLDCFFDFDERKPLRRCSFIGCDVGIKDFYSSPTLVNCVFKNNTMNWLLSNKGLKSITFKNCAISPAKTKDILTGNLEFPPQQRIE